MRWSGVIIVAVVAMRMAAQGVPAATNVAAEEALGFVVEGGIRDPFWPVGFFPRKPVAVSTNVAATNLPPQDVVEAQATATPTPPPPPAIDYIGEALKTLRVGAIVRKVEKTGPRYYATVNGQIVQEGDVIPVKIFDRVVKLVVKSIGPKKVIIEQWAK